MWIGVGLIVAAVVVPVVLVVSLVLPAFDLDQRTIPADGRSHSLTLPANADYAVFTSNSEFMAYLDPECRAVDAAGNEIALRTISGDTTVNNWKVLRRFDTGSGSVAVTCTSEGSIRQDVKVGEYPRVGAAVGGIFGAIGAGGLLGVAGIACIVVTLVRRSRA